MPKSINKNFTEPKVKNTGKEWYVWFRYLDDHTGKMKLIIKKGGANYSNLPGKERLAQLNALKKAIEFKLTHQGWNPITNTYPASGTQSIEMDLEKLRQMDFGQALDYAYNKKLPDWSKKSSQDYSSKIKYLKQSAAALGILHSGISELKRFHYRNLLEDIRQTRKLSASGYNTYRDYLSSLLGELDSYEIIEYNPIEKIKPKDTIKIRAHKPPTKDQQLLIMNRIREVDRNYYRFLSVLYGCTIRPKEICGLKIKHLHKLEQFFRLTPDNESSTKTKMEREPVIPDWVMNF